MKYRATKKYLIALLAFGLLFSTADAQAKLFSKKSIEKEPSYTSIDIVNEFPPEAGADTQRLVTQTKEELKKPAEKEKRSWKSKNDYSDYLIPTDAFMPVDFDNHTVHKGHSGSISGSVSKAMELNLADCLELALIHNPKIKSAYAFAAAEKTKKIQTVANYSPRVDLSTGFSRMKPDSGSDDKSTDPFNHYLVGSIGVRQLVYDFGYTQNLFSISKLDYENALGNVEYVVNTVICQLKSAYYALLLAKEKERVLHESVDYFEKTYNQAKAFWQIGVKAKIDVTIAEANLASAKADLIQARGDVDVATATLNNAMGLPYIPAYLVSEVLPYEKTTIGMKEAVEIANKSRPDIQKAITYLKIADQGVKLAKKTFFPAIEFSGNWNNGRVSGEGGRSWYDAGLYLGFPVINPLLIKGQVEQAKHLYSMQQYESKSMVNDVYYEIQSAHERVMDTQERIPATLAAVKKAQEAFELATGRYRVGEGDAIELKDAQLQYQRSQLAYCAALYEFNIAKANLERSIGQTLKTDTQKAAMGK